MSKSEETDLTLLIHSLSPKVYNSFKRNLNLKSEPKIKLKLLETIRKKKVYNKSAFIKKHKLASLKFNTLKFDLFQELIEHLKISDRKFSDINVYNELIELEVLLKNALYTKAKRKLSKLKKIATEKCDFDICCLLQKKAVEFRLFNYEKGKNSFREGVTELENYIRLSENLNSYKLLAEEICELHYQFLDKRIKNRDELLNYNNNPLLQDVSKAESVLSVYFFYRAKSFIYMGNNDFIEGKRYSFLAYEHLNNNPSKYRDDFLLKFKALNNYLDSSMNLMETSPFEKIHPEILKLIDNNKHNFNAIIKSFSTIANDCLVLNYLWIKKDVNRFLEIVPQIKKNYDLHSEMTGPNFSIEVLLSIARMYFLNGMLKEANYYCVMISDKKTNPASLIISCGNILRIMIQHDLGDHQLISHLVPTSKYFLKSNERLFNLEKSILNGLHKIKPYYSEPEKRKLFKELYAEVYDKFNQAEDSILDKKIGILDWLKSKIGNK
ncbi:hypothetical protein [Tenacibaculum jejuense]|uniref:Uncharacterized protein n=1 Tax=Tenacibaculum jejuense TaxID=584609 RepID=A0A238U586_9FLAO|nr:hypothetical protein [Tenacibaculum jejuense]SNR14369.1 protein of unknown function [Tenacibaculum jejuense]